MYFENGPIALRRFTMDDLEAVHAYASDPETVEFQGFGPNTLEQSRAWLEKVVANDPGSSKELERYYLAVVRQDTGEVIGCASLWRTDRKHPTSVAFGLTIRKDQWRQGFGARAAEMSVLMAVTLTDVNLLEVLVRREDIASQKIMKGIPQFKHCDELEVPIKGRIHQMDAYGKWISRI